MTRSTSSTGRRRRRLAPLTLLAAAAAMVVWLAIPVHLVAQDASDLVGDYTIGINADDIPQDLANGSMLIGQWKVSFQRDGTYQMERLDVGTMVSGTYEVQDGTVTITDENGLLSCSNPVAGGVAGDVSQGTYNWTVRETGLTLVAVEDGCGSRKLILDTRELIRFIACRTPDTSEIPPATPEATPVSGLEQLIEEASTPEASPVAGVDAAIDDVLGQMTACWATGEPGRFLPLLSQDYQKTLVSQSPSEEEFLKGLAIAMGTPIVFERSGDVQVVDDTHVTVIVRTGTGSEQNFVRFSFVFEDGAWKWNGPA